MPWYEQSSPCNMRGEKLSLTRKHMATLTKKEAWSGYILLQWVVESPIRCIVCGRDCSM